MKEQISRFAQALSLLCILAFSPQAIAQSPTSPIDPGVASGEALTADDIVVRMVERNEQRARDLASYTGRRIYRLDYRGFPGGRSAEMEVQAVFTAPAHKEFTVIKESGSKLVLNRVFKKLLESEREAQDEENRKLTALTPGNYKFELTGTEELEGRKAYVLSVEPHKPSKFLYRGRIWVDAADFAVMKIDASPAKNPSFWISKVTIAHAYGKYGQFWLPAHNTSVSKVRLGGTATLTIDYLDYNVVAGSAVVPGGR